MLFTVTVEPHNWLVSKLEDNWRLVVKITSDNCKKAMSEPVKPSLNFLGFSNGISLEHTQLIDGKCTRVCFSVVFSTECDHALGFVMFSFVPRWIIVVPLKIGIRTTWHRTAETNFSS